MIPFLGPRFPGSPLSGQRFRMADAFLDYCGHHVDGNGGVHQPPEGAAHIAYVGVEPAA